jgi:hypothetical protein
MQVAQLLLHGVHTPADYYLYFDNIQVLSVHVGGEYRLFLHAVHVIELLHLLHFNGHI